MADQEDGEKKLLAAARHIAQTLSPNEFMADDILNIYSSFDGRFARDKFDAPSDRNLFNTLDRRVSRYLAIDDPICLDPSLSFSFLEAVDDLLSVLPRLPSHLAEDLVSRVMCRLTDEFRLLMERGPESFMRANRGRRFDSPGEQEDDTVDDEDVDEEHVPVAQPLTDYDVLIDALPPSTVADLQKFSRRLLAAEFGEACSHVYSASRRDFLEESMSRLGLAKLTIDDVQRMTWQEVEYHIERWTKATPVVLRILFPSERRLADRVFFDFPTAAEFSYMESIRVAAVQLLNFADAIALGGRAPERLYKVLDLYDAMRELLPEFETNFSDQYCLSLRNEAMAVWKRLGEAVRGIFMKLESSIRDDPANAPIAHGSVHPITRYVLNFLRTACQWRDTLEQIFEEGETMASTLPVQVAWIMELLQCNLEMKSRSYESRGLRCIFMINNNKYILQKIRDSELESMLGDEWVRSHNNKIKQLQSNFFRASWNRILSLLGSDCGGGMKDRLRDFNAKLEEMCAEQNQWVILDEQQRVTVREAIAAQLLPAYRTFLDRFRTSPDVGANADRYVRFRVEDVASKVDRLFQGASSPSRGSRK